MLLLCFFFFSSRRGHTRYIGDWRSDVCSSDLCAPCATTGRGVRGRAAGSRGREGPAGARAGRTAHGRPGAPGDRKSVVQGKSVDRGGRGRLTKKKEERERNGCRGMNKG